MISFRRKVKFDVHVMNWRLSLRHQHDYVVTCTGFIFNNFWPICFVDDLLATFLIVVCFQLSNQNLHQLIKQNTWSWLQCPRSIEISIGFKPCDLPSMGSNYLNEEYQFYSMFLLCGFISLWWCYFNSRPVQHGVSDASSPSQSSSPGCLVLCVHVPGNKDLVSRGSCESGLACCQQTSGSLEEGWSETCSHQTFCKYTL